MTANTDGLATVGVSAVQRREIRKECIGNAIGNAFFNGLIAWSLLKSKDSLSLWGEEGIAVDVSLTALLLLFIVALIVIALNRRKLNKGQMSPMQWDGDSVLHRLLSRLPHSLFARACCFGLFGLLVIAPLTMLAFYLPGFEQLPTMNYVIFKSAWTGLMAGIMTAPMIMLALVPTAGK